MKNTSYNPWDLVEYYKEPISDLFKVEDCNEISVNRFDEIFLKRHGKYERADISFKSEEEVVSLISQIGNALGQPVDDETHPILDARMPDGTRVCAVLYPVSSRGSSISFRLFPEEKITAQFLMDKRSLTVDMMEYLKLAVICRCNMLISGGTGSGKTTLLNVLCDFIPIEDRVLTVEDTRELQLKVTNLVSLEAPLKRKKDDAQHVDMSLLIRTCLRKDPTRIIVGEIRDGQAATAYLHAINTGHSATSTIHANSAKDALNRMQILVAGEGSLPHDVVKAQVRSNIDIVLHAEETPNHGKRIVSISEVDENGSLTELWQFNHKEGRHTKKCQTSSIYERLEKFGLDLPN